MKPPPDSKSRLQIVESMPVGRAIWKLSIPTMVAMLIQVVYNMTNIFFLGKLNNSDMVAAISICMPIVMSIQAFGNIFAMGGASLISRLLGEGRREDANHASAISFWAAAILCILASLVIYLNLESVLRLCGASHNTMDWCKTYMSIMLIGGVFIGLQMTAAGLLRSEGETTTSMVGMISGSVLNIVLDPILIFLFHMNIAGAALGSVIGNAVGFAYYLLFFLRKKGILSISLRHLVFKKFYFSNIFKIGIPASLDNILMSFGMAFANVIAASFSDDVVAATAICIRLTSVGVMLTIGMAQGCQPLMGYSYGSHNIGRLFETIRKAMRNATALCIIVAVLLFVFAGTLVSFFILDESVVLIGTRLLRVMALAMPFLGVQMILRTLFQSIGYSVAALVLTLGRQGIFLIPSLLIMSKLWGLNGFMAAMPTADILTTILAVLLLIFVRKKLKTLRDEEAQAAVAPFDIPCQTP